MHFYRICGRPLVTQGTSGHTPRRALIHHRASAKKYTDLSPLLTARALPQAWLRVALGFHSAAQVLAGAALGAATAAAWHRLGAERALPAAARQPALAWVLRGATALALALFALRIVLQWARPRAPGGGRREPAALTL